MFEDPEGLKFLDITLGTPAWKTKNFYTTSVRWERGEDVEK
jgi:hypothetical protein